MQKVRQILLFLDRGYSEREISRQVGVSRPTIHHYSVLFDKTGKDYTTLFHLTDAELNAEIGSQKPVKNPVTLDKRKAYFLEQVPYFLSELTKVGVTRYLLWQEYSQQEALHFGYSRFCDLLGVELARQKPAMHHTHSPGDPLEVDFAGSKLHYVS